MQSMAEEYNKILNRPEARHRYWHIIKANREFFPDEHETFKVEFDGKVYELKVNHKDDVMTGQLYERFRFMENDSIIITRKKNGTYSLKAPDTKLYPNFK